MTGDKNTFRLNPYLFSGIYTNMVMEDGSLVVASNKMKKEEAKKNSSEVNAIKKDDQITKGEISFGNTLSMVANFLRYNNTTKD